MEERKRAKVFAKSVLEYEAQKIVADIKEKSEGVPPLKDSGNKAFKDMLLHEKLNSLTQEQLDGVELTPKVTMDYHSCELTLEKAHTPWFCHMLLGLECISGSKLCDPGSDRFRCHKCKFDYCERCIRAALCIS